MVDYIGRALVADALREWREQLQSRATVSPLRDLAATQASLIDLRASHPSGLAQLFASRPTALTSLLRDGQVQEQALHRGRLIFDEADRVRAATGAWTAALVIGTVAWTETHGPVEMPLLLRPVGLEPFRERDLHITLRDAVAVNPVFVTLLRERAAAARVSAPLPAVSLGRDFDPRPLWEAVREHGGLIGEDLEVRDRLLLGAFDDPEQRLLDDLDDCDPVITASTVLAAAAGDQDARASLAEPLPAVPKGDRDPFAERGVGDLDDVQFAVLDLIATGRDLFLQCPPGSDAVGMAAAIGADGAASGKTVGIVGGQEGVLRGVVQCLQTLGADDLTIDGTSPSWNADARARLLASITLGTPPVEDAALRTAGEGLLRSRAALHRRFDALHRSHRPWGVSAFETVQAIVRVTTSEPQPGASLRLTPEAGAIVADHGFASVAAAISERITPDTDGDAESQGESSDAEAPAVDGEPWWSGHVDPDDAPAVTEALSEFLGRSVPKLRAEAAIAAHETGVDEAASYEAWVDQVDMFEDLREVLEIFSPAVFHRSLHDLVAATAPHGSSRHVDLPRRDRRALMRRGVELLRPGRGKEHLHEDLVRAHEAALRWRSHCSAGGWPVVPDDFDVFADRVAQSAPEWSRIAPPVGAATGIENVESLPWDDMVRELDRLDAGAPGTWQVARVEPIDIDLESAGFSPLIEDLLARGADAAQVRRDLEFAWWAAAFDAIVRADASLTEQGALGAAVEEFRRSDSEFAARRIGPLMRAAAERRRTAIARHPDLARDLFAALVEGADASVKELWRDFGPLTTALRPVAVAKAEQVPRLIPPSRALDIVVVVAAESLALAELVPALARAKQVVVVADAHAATRSAVTSLAAMLPHVTLHASPQPRDVRVSTVLSEAAYGRSLAALPAAGGQGRFAVDVVDAVGSPVAGAREVESTRAEIMAVVEYAARAADSLPRRSLIVVAGNDLHAARLRDALSERSRRLAAVVPVQTLGEAAGLTADEVVFSLGYAPDVQGAVPRRLGALSRSWGAAALVQMLTASRADLTVFTALVSRQLVDVEIEDGHGVDDLRALLDAVDTPPVPPERPEPAPSDWLLADVAHRLRRDGYAVHVRYGSGPDTVPMVVGGRHDRGYSLAVVTDEAAPAGSASLRDRMRWQRSSLEALGWRVLPLWTIDVFMDPDAAAEAVRLALGDGEPEPVPVQQELDIEVEVIEPAPEVEEEIEMPGASTLLRPEDTRPAAVEHAEEPEIDEPAPLTLGIGTLVANDEPVSNDAPEPEPEPGPEPEPEPERPAPRIPTMGFGVPKLADASAPRTPPTSKPRGTDRPLIPTRASEDRDEGWGGRDADNRDEEIKRERPPHW